MRVTGYDDCNDVVSEVQTGFPNEEENEENDGGDIRSLSPVNSPFVTVTVSDIFVDIKFRYVYSNWSTVISDYSCKLHLLNLRIGSFVR